MKLMYPPGGTKQDEYEYHDSEAEYHLRASRACTRRSDRLIEEMGFGINSWGGWRHLGERASRSTLLAKHHNTMAKFHIRMMRQI